MQIAFLYIAEAYQCYHGAAIALELARRPGWQVVSYYNDDESPRHLERARTPEGAPRMAYRRLGRAPLTRALQAVKRLGMFKDLVMRDNAAELDRYDAVFAVENSVAALRDLGAPRPRLI